jgi:hypothetical protein
MNTENLSEISSDLDKKDSKDQDPDRTRDPDPTNYGCTHTRRIHIRNTALNPDVNFPKVITKLKVVSTN